MRRSRRTSGGIRAFLVGISLPVVIVFAIFSLMPYSVMTGQWPLGIRQNEVEFYQRWCDHRPGQNVVDHTERFDLDSAGTCADAEDPDKHWRRFSASGYSDSARVRRMSNVDGGWMIDFPEDRLFGSQRSITLIPANAESIRARFAQLVADENGLLTPEVGFIRLFSCGRELGVFTKEERITSEFLEKHGLADASLMGEPSTHGAAQQEAEKRTLLAAVEGDQARVDSVAATTLALLRCTDMRYDASTTALAFDRSTGRLLPLHRAPQPGDDPLFADARDEGFATYLASPASTGRVHLLAERLQRDSAKWAAQFSAVEELWAPALAKGASIAFVKARLQSERSAFMEKLFHPEPEKVFGIAEATASANQTARATEKMDPWLEPFAQGDTIRFVRGKYVIDHDISVPQGMAVIIEKGARFAIGSGRSLLVNGPLTVQGTDVNPVFIRPQDEGLPYGVIAVHGNGRTVCDIRGVRMSGGSTAWLADRYHSGMLTLMDCQVSMEKCTIGGSRGEDAVNVKRGSIQMLDCSFEEGQDDLVDIDRSTGAVRGCTFTGRTGGDSTAFNGDGLDASGSHLLVQDCLFVGLLDKGLSIGESSQVFSKDCTFRNNGLAIAVKDLSVAHADGNAFIGNRIVFGVYQKKPVFGGGVLTVYNNTLEGNGQEREVDSRSKIVSSEKVDEKVEEAFSLTKER